MTFGTSLREAAPARGSARAILAAGVFVFSAWSWCAHGGLRTPAFDVDTFDYAQMARQVYRGEGFTMLQTFPYVQRFLAEHGASTQPPWPNTTRFPLIALEEATAFCVAGPGDRGVLLAGGAMFVATAVAVFLLGNSLFGALAGCVAAALVATDAEQLRISRSGLLETGAGFFIVAVALALVAATESARRRAASAIALGMLIGLAFLQRYDLLTLAPVAVALLLLRCDSARGRSALWCSAGFLATAGPWLGRNLVTVGTLLGTTSVDRNLLGGIVAGDVYMGSETMSPWRVAFDHWPLLVGKLDLGRIWLWQHAEELLGGRLAAWAGLVTLASPLLSRSRAARTVWLFLAATFVARGVLLSLMHNELRFYLSFTPLVMVLATGTAASTLRLLPARARVAEPLAAVVALLVAASSLPHGPWSPLPLERPATFVALRTKLPAGTVVASDTSWNVAWYSERPSIRFSGQWSELTGIEQLGVRVGAVLVRGPAAREFEEAHERAGGGLFTRESGVHDGYRLWIRNPDSASLAER